MAKRKMTSILAMLLALPLAACGAASDTGAAATEGVTTQGTEAAGTAAAANADAENAAADSTAAGADADYTLDELLEMDWSEIEELAKQEGTVIFSSWYNEAGFTEMLKSFEDQYGIRVQLTISDASAFSQKVLAEKDGEKGSIDVALISGDDVQTLLGAGALGGPILDKIENKDLLDADSCEYQEGVELNGYLVPLYRNQTGFLYNSNNISEDELPQTWEELAAYISENPKKFGMCTPENGGSGKAFVQLVIEQLCGDKDKYYEGSEVDPANTENWSLAWDWFRENEDNIVYTTSNNDSISRLNQGELDLVPAWDDDSCVARAAGELADFAKLYIPEMGSVGGGDTVGMLANAQHKAASLLLINWLTGEEGQELVTNVLSSIPARTDIPAAETMIDDSYMQYRTKWLPAWYKAEYVKEFTEQVLQN